MNAILLGVLAAVLAAQPPSLDGFPSTAVCRSAVSENGHFGDWLEGLRTCFPRRHDLEVLEEERVRVYHAWDCLLSLRTGEPRHDVWGCEIRYTSWDLKRLIGPAAFAQGRMPEPVPWRLFPERD